MIDFDIQVQIALKSQSLLNSELEVCPRNNSSPVQARFTKFEPDVQNNLFNIPVVLWGDAWTDSRSRLFQS